MSRLCAYDSCNEPPRYAGTLPIALHRCPFTCRPLWHVRTDGFPSSKWIDLEDPIPQLRRGQSSRPPPPLSSPRPNPFLCLLPTPVPDPRRLRLGYSDLFWTFPTTTTTTTMTIMQTTPTALPAYGMGSLPQRMRRPPSVGRSRVGWWSQQLVQSLQLSRGGCGWRPGAVRASNWRPSLDTAEYGVASTHPGLS